MSDGIAVRAELPNGMAQAASEQSKTAAKEIFTDFIKPLIFKLDAAQRLSVALVSLF